MTAGRTAVTGLSIALLIVLTCFVINADQGATPDRDRHSARELADDTPFEVTIAASATDVVNGTLVHFNVVAYTGNGYIANLQWNYTNGSDILYFPGWTADIVFHRVGNFTVMLTAVNSTGTAAKATIVIHVRPLVGANNPPVAEAGPDAYVTTQMPVALDGLASTDDQGIAKYVWNFSDNGNAVNLSGPMLYYTFFTVGNYTITLTVTDVCGLTASDTMIAHISPGPVWIVPHAEAGPNQTARVGEEVTFDGSGSIADNGAGFSNYTWMILDTGIIHLYGVKVTYVFWTVGDHVVTLYTVDDNGFPSSDYLTVNVLPGGPPHAEAGPDATISSGTTFQFNGSGSTGDEAGLDYLWNFVYNGTHVILYGMSPVFQFTKVGTYAVSLTVTDAGGLSDSDTLTITVTDSGQAGRASFLGKYGVWLVMGGAETALMTLAALVVMRQRGDRKS